MRITAEGLSLWREALIDQHFLTRQRDNRLISAVFDHPSLVGVGIDLDIVEKVGPTPVNTPEQVYQELQRRPPGRAGALTVRRGNTLLTVHWP